MGTDKEDTDPSSPGALRPRVPAFEASGSASPPYDRESDADIGDKPTTDPGLGPPSSTRSPSVPGQRTWRSSVSVPPPSRRGSLASNAITPPDLTPIAAPLSSPPSNTKDSVELLLEGMAGPRPERRKTTPQSDGEASAAYHAEHGLRPARTSSAPGPKVMVERTAGGAPLVRDRPVVAPAPKVPIGSREAFSTFVPARVLRRRVALALVAGVLIVLLSFMTLRLTGKRHDALAPQAGAPAQIVDPVAAATTAAAVEEPTAATPNTAAASTVEPQAAVEPPAAATPATATPTTATPTPSVAPVASAASAPTSRAANPGHASMGMATRHHHTHTPVAEEPAPTGADLGEYKAKF
jgi:hypothetical protein